MRNFINLVEKFQMDLKPEDDTQFSVTVPAKFARQVREMVEDTFYANVFYSQKGLLSNKFTFHCRSSDVAAQLKQELAKFSA
jgi:bifunctional DNase/RNase